jgi:hypothetical protein
LPASKRRGEIGGVTFLKTHPFWTLLFATLALAVLLFVVFVPGHGSGGMGLGPIHSGK